jgi:GTP-binding protein
MFIDEAEIYVRAGKGGDGAVSFRREKYIPNGGPDGGDGGRGGKVFFEAETQAHGLSDFVRRKRFLAPNGQPGMGSNCAGKHGEDLIVKIPLGTQIYHHDELIADFVSADQRILVAKGGNGGWGNQHFASSIKQAPHWAQKGLKGDSCKLRLELKVIADVGLVGLPNAGKSTLLSVLSNARPKIANYPFTTLEPSLGILKEVDKNIVIADIPGLIEGASDGKGLGVKFLKHIERTRAILHIIDISGDVISDYKTIRAELTKFSEKLAKKKEIVAINKIELADVEYQELIKAEFKKIKVTPIFISAATHYGIKDLVKKIKMLS